MENSILENYRRLVRTVDRHCAGIAASWNSHMACRKGCDDCCRPLEVFPVEAAAIAEAAAAAPEEIRALLGKTAADRERTSCVLLHEGSCLLYDARPLICRTHGFPVLVREEEKTRADFCPKNFTGLPSLPGSAFVDLDRLNETLAAVNLLFLREDDREWPERVPLAEAVKFQDESSRF